MTFETPSELMGRLRLGREEYCQRLLTSLILGGPYPRWNTRSRPGDEGVGFLERLWGLSFGDPWPGGELAFVDEFELLPPVDTERGGAPDYAVLWPDLVWLVELKTERTSHRRGQIPGYFRLCRHHHPACRVAITYLTQPARYPLDVTDDWASYSHLTWLDVAPLIRETWPSPADRRQQEVVTGLLEAIDGLGMSAAEWRKQVARRVPEPVSTVVPQPSVDEGLVLANLTATDHLQRAVETPSADLEDLLSLRLGIRNALANSPPPSPLRHVMPWLWRWASTGQPMTAAGAETGYELRLSWYESPRYGPGGDADPT